MTRGMDVDFYYSINSRYSYLAATRIAALEAETGCAVAWRPLRVSELTRRRGPDPFDGGAVSGQYEWPYRQYDAECWAAYYGVPYREPNFDDYDSHSLARACVAAKRLGAVAPYSHALFRAVFVDGGAIDDARCADIAEAVGLSRGMFVEASAQPSIDDALAAAEREAFERGAFGVPTFFAGDRMFWGNDRLVLLRHHLSGRSD